MHKIGTVEFVQVQRSRMKTGEGENRVYNPQPLLVVDKLLLTEEGILGITGNGDEVIDVHHIRHPESRCRGNNTISLGFVQHYRAMRDYFGSHMHDGIAAENIIIRAEADVTPELLGTQLMIGSRDDGNQTELRDVMVAAPCREFSQFAAQRPLTPAELKQALQFLGNGRRGFYATLVANDCQCVVQAGDTLYAV